MYFSVIVPIYGVEAFLPACVESILAQTFRDFELILVDDGSPDGCPALCDGYAARDARVRVLHKPNGGLVSARQAGLTAATGRYIVPVDGDDWLDTSFLADAHRLLEDTQADLVSFGITYVGELRRRTETEPLPAGCYDRDGVVRRFWPQMLMPDDMHHLFFYLCGKAIRRELLYPHQMAVDPSISLGEDVACLMPVWLEVQRAVLQDTPRYFCRERAGSESRAFRPAQCEQITRLLRHLSTLQAGPDFAAQIDRYAAFLAFGMMNVLLRSGSLTGWKEMLAFLRTPAMRRHLTAARFGNVTPKMRITYRLLRSGRYSTALTFLRVCAAIKRN